MSNRENRIPMSPGRYRFGTAGPDFLRTEGGLQPDSCSLPECRGEITVDVDRLLSNQGSTCLVYEGTLPESGRRVIIKEFYPCSEKNIWAIARNSGDRNNEIRKRKPDTIDVRPVLPPSAMPEEDSTNVVIVEVPNTAPTVVPMASERSAPLIPGSFPSSSSISAFDAQPISVPRVSNISTNRKANMMTIKLMISIPSNDSCMKVGAMLSGMEKMPDGIRL